MIKDKLERLIKSKLFPFILLALAMLIIHLHVPIPVGDDGFYLRSPESIFDWKFVKFIYINWSSRLIINFFTVAFLRLPSLLWRVANPVVIALLAYAVSALFIKPHQKQNNWFIVFLFMVYPFKEMLDAGWVTMSLNYLWPMSFGLLALITLKKILLKSEISFVEFIIGLLFIVFAANQEIMCIILLITTLAAAIFLRVQKRSHWFVYLSLAICIGSLIFILTTPGNFARNAKEVRWFLDFDHISLIEKMEIGFSSTFSQLIFNFNFIFFTFSLLLFIAINHKYDDLLYRAYAIIPLGLSLIFGNSLQVIVDRLFPFLSLVDTNITKYGFITLGNFTQIHSYVPLLILYATGSILFVLLYLAFGNTWEGMISIIVLLLGVISRIIVSLSPTIWASGIRTHFLLFLSLLICSAMIFSQLVQLKTRRFMENFLIISGFIASISFLNFFMSTL